MANRRQQVGGHRKSFSLSELQDNVKSSFRATHKKSLSEVYWEQNRNIAACAMEDFVEEEGPTGKARFSTSDNSSSSSLNSSSSLIITWPTNEEKESNVEDACSEATESTGSQSKRRASLEMLRHNLSQSLSKVVLKTIERRASMGDPTSLTSIKSLRDDKRRSKSIGVASSSHYVMELEDTERNSFHFNKRDYISDALRSRLEQKKMLIPEVQQGGITKLATDDLVELKEIESSNVTKNLHRSVGSSNSLASLA
eukprot:CAMPEP_0194218896 /NCGR_PEP_ID=MMETSP0156-20130528/24776_1 /TAXON_ID=33649 /ORGANISM="Thalassionema nitzschioides, Strain L26-B" /LENGTH=254 /DNA_ID=CAMNT_0038948399 /DNA_START=611 /DNA_END=1371 /DNA_ORIENTATION=+